jgi:myo-inositol-1(or 4)-monophosphatase
VSIEKKSDDSPVTIADKKAEEKMREMIISEFPDHGIIGEEFGDHKEDAEYKWILDPIDGTKSFICGALTFGTLIGLVKNDKPILGLFHQPILNEKLIGDNIETKINGVTTIVRDSKSLGEAVLLTTDHFNIGKYKNQKAFDNLVSKVKLYRHWGDCYGYFLVATGYADIMIDPIMFPWDALPLIPIIKGAGGKITDYEGNGAVKGNSTVAASTEIHSQVISLLNPS